MTTVSAGTTGSYTFAAGEQANISPDADEAAYVVVTRGASQIYAATIRGGETIGPYLSGDVMSLTAQRGDIDYTIDSGVTSHAVTAQGNSTDGYSLIVDSGVLAVSETSPYVTVTGPTAGTTVATGACEVAGWYCSVAAGDATLYDATSVTGTAFVPAEATVAGPRPILGAGTNGKVAFANGATIVLSGAATVRVLVA